MKIFITEKEVNSNIEAIETTGDILLKNKCVVPEFIDACTSREKEFPTGLFLSDDFAVAIPHGNSSYVNEDSISILRTTDPVLFYRMENPSESLNCRLIFNLALSDGTKHITVLRKLMGLLQEQTFVDDCLNKDIESLSNYITRLLQSE